MKSKNETKLSQEKYLTLNVSGMTCASCKNKIELNLEKIDGVASVDANVKKGEVKLAYNTKNDSETKNNEVAYIKNEVKAELTNLGYEIEKSEKSNATRRGILYGLIPHAGCIAFILASIAGASIFMNFMRPMMMNTYFFYALIGVSLIFATISAGIYLKQNKLLSFKGIRRQKKYLATLYGTTIAINLALFLVIFPLSANLGSASASTSNEYSQTLNLEVDIPCSGHASLIMNDLNQVSGVQEVKYAFPNIFTVKYDGNLTSPDLILSAEIFEEFPGSVVN